MQQHNSKVGIAQAAEQLRISTDTVRRRVKNGTIEGIIKGGKWEITLPSNSVEPQPVDGTLVQALERHITDLEHALAERDRQVTELHAILTRAITPALPAPAPSWWKRMFRK